MNATQPLTLEPAEIPAEKNFSATPEFVRLPKPGRLCPFTGLSRSYMNLLILPTQANKNKPPVKSFVLRKKGARTGVRVISYPSLRDYILNHPETTD